jgi:hypothetical protein
VLRAKLLQERTATERPLEGLRRFIEQGDTSAKVREWLREAEHADERLRQRLAELEAEERQAPVQVHPG